MSEKQPYLVFVCDARVFENAVVRLQGFKPIRIHRVESLEQVFSDTDLSEPTALIVSADTLSKDSLPVVQALTNRWRDLIFAFVSKELSPKLRAWLKVLQPHVVYSGQSIPKGMVRAVSEVIQYRVRSYPRARVPGRVEIALLESKILGDIEDLSDGGVAVSLQQELPAENVYAITIQAEGNLSLTLQANALRSWQEPSRKRFYTALQFIDLPVLAKRQLRGLVLSELEKTDNRPVSDINIVREHEDGMLRMWPRRHHMRFRIRVEYPGSTQKNYFRVRDISLSGAFIYSSPDSKLSNQVGQKLNLLIMHHGKSFQCTAEIVRVALPKTRESFLFPKGFGVRFIEWKPGHLKKFQVTINPILNHTKQS